MKKSKILSHLFTLLLLFCGTQSAFGEGGLIFTSQPTIPSLIYMNSVNTGSSKLYFPFTIQNITAATSIQLSAISGFSGAVNFDTSGPNYCNVGTTLAHGASCTLYLYIDSSQYLTLPQTLNIYGVVTSSVNEPKEYRKQSNAPIFLHADLPVLNIIDPISVTIDNNPANASPTNQTIDVTANPQLPATVTLGTVSVSSATLAGFFSSNTSDCNNAVLTPGASCTIAIAPVSNDGSVVSKPATDFNVTVPVSITSYTGTYSKQKTFNALYERALYAGGNSSATQATVAKWNGTSWSYLDNATFATGTTPAVNALAFGGATGRDLLIGGTSLTTVTIPAYGSVSTSNLTANNVTLWNHTLAATGQAAGQHVWSRVGEGANNAVRAITVLGNNVYVGGSFTALGDFTATRLAQWNGKSWSSLGSGVANQIVYALAVDSNNNLYVSGNFTNAGGVATADRVAQWNGSSWSGLGSGVANNIVYALATDSSNNLYIGGSFTNAGGVATADRVAKWNGSSWSGLGSGIANNIVYALTADSNGNLYAAGNFTNAGGVTNASYVAKATNSSGTYTWSKIPNWNSATGVVSALALTGNELYIGGSFTFNTTTGNITNIAKFNTSTSTWSSLSGRSDAWSALVVSPLAITLTDPSPGLYNFAEIYNDPPATTPQNHLAYKMIEVRNPTASAITIQNISVTTSANLQNLINYCATSTAGCLYKTDCPSAPSTLAAGSSCHLWLQAASNSSLVSQTTGTVTVALNLSNSPNNYQLTNVFSVAYENDLYAGGNFTTAGGSPVNFAAKWNGTTWSALNGYTQGINLPVNAFALANGDLYLGGNFTSSGFALNHLARWDGAMLAPLTTTDTSGGFIFAVVADSNNNLYVGGNFTAANSTTNTARIAKWNGSSWLALGTGITTNIVYALAADGSNNVYAGGNFTTVNGTAMSSVAKWNNSTSTWSALSTGANNIVFALATDSSNNLYGGGSFTTAGGVTVNRIAKWNGSTWSNMTTGGTVGVNGNAYALITNGTSLYAGGVFTSAGNVAVVGNAKWNGTAWSVLAAGMGTGANVSAYALLGNNLYAAGNFTAPAGNIAVANVSATSPSWSALGTGISGGNNIISALIVAPSIRILY